MHAFFFHTHAFTQKQDYAKANYTLSISIYSYNNPTDRCASCTSSSNMQSQRGCCDNHNNFGVCSQDELCDPGLLFCLLPLSSISNRDCVDNTIDASPLFAPNATSVTINAIQNTFLGLDVPFLIEGISNEWMVSINNFQAMAHITNYICMHDAHAVMYMSHMHTGSQTLH